MRTVSMQQLWDEFDAAANLCEHGEDMATAKLMFASGAMAVLNAIANRRVLDPDDTLDFAMRELVKLGKATSQLYGRPAYPAASEQ